MPSWNDCTFIGHLTRDIERREVGGSSVASSAIAVNRKYTTSAGEKREEVAFIDFSVWGKSGDILHQYAKKGDAILLQGRIRQENWNDKETGAKRSKLSLVVENFQFLGGKQQDRDDSEPPRQQRAPGQRPPTPSNQPPYGEEAQFDESEIPFAWSGHEGQPI